MLPLHQTAVIHCINMDFKGTQGFWKVCEKHETILDENGYGIAQVHGILNEDKWKYNSLLISKAPEMLKMLIRISETEDFDITDYMEIKELIREVTEI